MKIIKTLKYINSKLSGFILIIIFFLALTIKSYFNEVNGVKAGRSATAALRAADSIKKQMTKQHSTLQDTRFTYNDFLIFSWYSRRNEAGELYYEDVPEAVINNFCTLIEKKDTLCILNDGDTIVKNIEKRCLTNFGKYLLKLQNKNYDK